MTQKSVADDEYGKLWRMLKEVARRVDEGSIPLEPTKQALQGIIEGKVRFAGEEKKATKFQPWKTLKLGTGLKIADDFRKALKKSGCKIGDWANDILGKPAFVPASTKEIEVSLVKVSVAELGFKNGATRQDIYDRAKELGLELCPPEVGPQLRLQYPDQPMDEWLLIGMEPISASVGHLHVFDVVRRGGGQWLYGHFGYPDDFWHGDDHWVFVCRK